MDVLFIHGNYPGQFVHLASALGAQRRHRVVFLTNREDPEVWQLPGVEVRRFDCHRQPHQGTHLYLLSSEQAVLNGQAVLRQLVPLLQEGFAPRLIVAHGGNGLQLFVKKVCPQARLVNYIEWYFSDATNRYLRPTYGLDEQCRFLLRNAVILQELEECDVAVTPTTWQWQQFPRAYQDRIRVIFDGVDTRQFRPCAIDERLQLEGMETDEPLVIEPEDLILSYATRGMEPLRGFPEFMRMLPPLLARFPALRVVVAGQDRVAYSYPPSAEEPSWKRHMLAELGSFEGRDRLHFPGSLNYRDYRLLLCRSDLHVYFSRPYVTSWGLFQAAACGARLMVNSGPAIDYVLPPDAALVVDLEDQAGIERAAVAWLEGALERRGQPRVSALKQEWRLDHAFGHWQQLLQEQLGAG
jgi:glycosyltransferase involved in cell wall biosynthesis